MAIHLYTGNLGGGKTLSSVERMVETWKRGGYVFTNVALNWPAIREFFLSEFGLALRDEQLEVLTHRDFPCFHRRLKRGTRDLPSLCVIDEAGKFFNARAWNKAQEEKQEVSDFLRESRKLHVDVIFIVQEEGRLDSSFRELMEVKWRFRDMKIFRLPIVRDYILQNSYHADTDVKLKGRWWRKDYRFFKLYDTDALVSEWAMAEHEELKPVELEQVAKPKKSMKGFIIVLCALGLLVWNTKKWWWPFGDGDGGKKQEKAIVSPAGGGGPAKGAGAYDVIVETLRFRYDYPSQVVCTVESGDLELGQLSRHGMVEKIQGPRVQIRTPEGRIVYLIARQPGENVEKQKPQESGLSLVAVSK